ncbi:MAG: Uma2 family endonuclease [Sphingobacteriales bacterium]|nr:Uma2 family endonuclease [Sphingobacteriales bacterium]MBI3718119.1 Uma2 family endonuclease [Sphingobacteriales bacterium]
MSSPVKILPHYTYDDYCKWEGRWELIEGIPYAMSPAPSPRHQWISANIKYELKDAIKKSGCKHCKVYDFIDIKVAEDTVLQPDAVIVCKEIEKPFLDFAASLVVEILSPSTALKDRNNKLFIYEGQKIPYYLIVDVEINEIEIYHLNSSGKYVKEKFSPTSPFTFILDKDCSIEVALNNMWE